jgi:hypothetical protein
MDAETFKAVIETIERLAYRAGAAEAERHTVERVDAPTIPAIVPAEHPTLARLRAALLTSSNDCYNNDCVAAYGFNFENNVTWGELRAWARGEGGKA